MRGACCDYKLAIKGSKRLEGILEEEFGAHGKGLHEKVSSVEKELGPELVRLLRRIATLRNKIVHEESFDQKSFDSNSFRDTFTKASKMLEKQSKHKKIHIEDCCIQ